MTGTPLPEELNGVVIERVIKIDSSLLYLVDGALAWLADIEPLIETGTLTVEETRVLLSDMLWCYLTGDCTDENEITLLITAANNNAWMDFGTTSTSGDLYIQKGNNNSCGFRFVGATIPNAQELISAFLHVYATDEFFDVPSSLLVRGIDKDTTGVWTTSNEPNPNTYTSATASISGAGWAADVWKIVDVTSIVQEIVDRAGYAEGNPIALIITNQDDSSDYVALRGYTVDTTKSAKLVVTF